MSHRSVILDSSGSPLALPRSRRVAARYDAAQTTDDNRRHWTNVDGLSADAANNPEVRRKLRNRARYEAANNSYARGLISTLANYIIGPGPRLQIVGPDRDANRLVEREFGAWSRRIGLAAKLRVLREARIHSGEGIAQFVTNPGHGHPVQLDLRIIEADRLATPDLMLPTARAVDGIRFDEWGNPTTYHILSQHPGGDILSGSGLEYDRVPAERIVHWFRQDRPEQHRGLPEIMPALPLFAQLRRYTLAVLAAAETAADIAAVIQSDAPADDDDAQPGAFDTLDLEKQLATVLPAGWKLGQLKAEQPTTVYSDFKHELLNEIARCLDIPFNIAAANSAGYNYASGRLDHQSFFRTIEVDRNYAEAVVLSPILSAWLHEAAVLQQDESPELALAVRQLGADVTFEWLWVGLEHIDPAKQSAADERDLKNGNTTRARIYAKKGLDWEQERRQAAREKALDEELGLLEKDGGVDMENVARAVRAGVPIGVAEARTAIGLPADPIEGPTLRFNDQDVLAYHVEAGVLTINEVRKVLGLPPVAWGNVPVRRRGIEPVRPGGSREGGGEDTDETETERDVDAEGKFHAEAQRRSERAGNPTLRASAPLRETTGGNGRGRL